MRPLRLAALLGLAATLCGCAWAPAKRPRHHRAEPWVWEPRRTSDEK